MPSNSSADTSTRRYCRKSAHELLGWARDIGGLPPAALSDPEFHDLLLPPLRADCAWLESYTYQTGPALTCPLSAFAGIDDPSAARRDLVAWAQETTGTFAWRQYPGGHFYFAEQLARVLADVVADLAATRDPP